jgi:hypothetical protein
VRGSYGDGSSGNNNDGYCSGYSRNGNGGNNNGGSGGNSNSADLEPQNSYIPLNAAQRISLV